MVDILWEETTERGWKKDRVKERERKDMEEEQDGRLGQREKEEVWD